MVADVQFDDLGDRSDGRDIVVVQAVARMHFEPKRGGERRALLQSPQLRCERRRVAPVGRKAIGTGVELDGVGLDFRGGFDLRRLRIDEERDLDAGARGASPRRASRS